MNCEICGRGVAVYKLSIEGSELFVCTDCKGFGRIIGKLKPQQKEAPKKPVSEEKKAPEKSEMIIENYGELIKNSREKAGLSQEEFAKKINEKASLVHNIETKAFEPPIELARKIERFLKIKLLQQYQEENETAKPTPDKKLTVGDVIKVKGE
ncbi:MAG: multiprotein bridging factor aMBF1 [Nanoarchaeota archaeon]